MSKEVVVAVFNLVLIDLAVRGKIEDLGAIPPKPEESTPEWMETFLRSEVLAMEQSYSGGSSER